MSQARIVPLVGPLLVLYLTLEVLGSSDALEPVAAVVCASALALSTLPFWVLKKRVEHTGARRVALLAVACGVALVRIANPALPSLYLDLSSALALPMIGGLVAHLAFDTPDRPAALARRRAWFVAFWALGGASAVAAVLAVAPIEWVFGWIVPARWTYAAPSYLLAGGLLGLVLRALRRRVGSTPEALASGGLAHLGTWAALAAAGVAFGLVRSDALSADSVGVRGLTVASAVALLAGHAAMLGVRRQAHAGRNTRAVIAGILTLGAAGTGVGLLADRIPSEPIPLGSAVALVVIGAALLHRLLARFVGRALAPYGGRLTAAAERALEGAVGATRLEEIAEAVLPELRRASDTIDADPLLFLLDPPRSVRIDAASVAHLEERELPASLRGVLAERAGEVVVAAPLAEQVVRRADLRGLVGALESLDALCVVPLAVDLELEGALVVARGRRRGALTLEEIDALERLGRHLSAQIALLGAQERARLRTRDAVLERDRLSDELETAGEEIARLRADARTLKAGGTADRYLEPTIAYSPAMRALMRRVDALAPVDAPVLLIGEEGSYLDRVAHQVHAASGRRAGAFVLAECASARPERAEAALFGESDEGQPGWLRLAEGGTLLLLDVPALSLAAQVKLAETLATRRAVLADGAGSYGVDTRVIATSRVPLGPLVALGAFDAELARRLEPLAIEVPPLRERAEDLPSLVLVALDRTCRVSARPVVGIDPEALAVLASYDWPGNLRELGSVIDRAVGNTTGKSVGLGDLPHLVPAEAPRDPLDGTYAEMERQILERALERSGGNKSEAARLLGLKRTTFFDKLKRHGLNTPPGSKKSQAGTAA